MDCLENVNKEKLRKIVVYLFTGHEHKDEHKLDEDYESINKTWDEFEKEAVRQYHDLNKNRCFAIHR